MKKIYLLFVSIFLFILITCSTKNKNQIDIIKKKITFEQYNIQEILKIPNIQIINTNSLITYRTEIHYGTENAVLLVISKEVDNTIKPLFVIEELYYLSKEEYYIRKLSNITDKSLTVELFEFYQKKKKRLLKAEVLYNDKKSEVKKLELYQKLGPDGEEYRASDAIAFFENFNYLKSRVLDKGF